MIKQYIHKVGAYPLLVGVAFAIFGCASAIPHLSSVDKASVPAQWKHVDFEHARTLYVGNCGACHELHEPSEFTAEDWKPIVAEMTTKANLSAEDSTSVLAYLSLASKQSSARDAK